MRNSERTMSILAHFGELKTRLLRVAIVSIIFIALSFIFYRQILDIFTAPISTIIESSGGMLTALRIAEPWTVAARIAILCGLTASWPVLVLEMSLFLRPGLKSNERKYLLLIAPFATLLFAAGASFTYFVLAPFFFRFLIGFGNSVSGLALSPSLESTIGLLVSLMFSMGVVFQVPLVILVLGKLGIVPLKRFYAFRRWAILLAFIAGAALTPTLDPLTQIMVAAPIIILYELGVAMVWLTTRKRKTTTPTQALDTTD